MNNHHAPEMDFSDTPFFDWIRIPQASVHCYTKHSSGLLFHACKNFPFLYPGFLQKSFAVFFHPPAKYQNNP